MMLAYLIDLAGRTVALVGDESGLRWESENGDLAERANRYVPPNSIPEWGGNPAAWAIRELARYIPGKTATMGNNAAESDKIFGMSATKPKESR